MNWLDVALALIFIASVVTSFRKGLTREVIGLGSVLLGLILGAWFYGTAASYLSSWITSRPAANLAGFFLVFCCVILIGSFVSYIVGKFLRVTGLSIADHALGAAFGLLRGALISVALITGIMAFTHDGRPPEAVVHSRLAPYAMYGARAIAAVAPYDLKEGFQKSYREARTAWASALHKGLIGKQAAEEKSEKRF
jgi:membrane protein required for colicin V production